MAYQQIQLSLDTVASEQQKDPKLFFVPRLQLVNSTTTK
jgi:hypothetical protein